MEPVDERLCSRYAGCCQWRRRRIVVPIPPSVPAGSGGKNNNWTCPSMMTPQQAYSLFVYADWAMMLVGLGALVASIGWGIYAILPTNKGRRRRTLRKALISFLVFAMFWGTQASVTIPF